MLKSVWIVYMLICHGTGGADTDSYCSYHTEERPVFASEAKCLKYAEKLRPLPIMTRDGYIVTRVECWHVPFVLNRTE